MSDINKIRQYSYSIDRGNSSVLDTLKLGAVALREGGRLLGDAVGDVSGASLPFRAEDV